MARNVMKHIVHNWGDNISSIHDGIGPPFVIPTKKMLESRPEDALVTLVKTVETVETAEPARTADPAHPDHFHHQIFIMLHR